MKSVYLCIGLLTVLSWVSTAQATTIYLIRHAEKQVTNPDDRDPGLTETGIARAEHAALILRSINFTAIYSSDFQRTRLTAEIIRGSRELNITIYDPRELPAFAEQLKAAPSEDIFLVAGHSNTTPELAQLLSDKSVEPIDESIYHNLYRVEINSDGSSSVDLLTVPPLSTAVDQ